MASPEGPNGGVSGSPVPRLLAREQRDLDALAEPLREGRRVSAFLVCPGVLRPAVIGYLTERTGRVFGEPVAVADAERMLTVLSEAAEAGSGEVRSLALDASAEGAVQALNWHREKLRRGASVWIWLEDVEALRVVRRVAPDAYSFRDVVVAVEGEESVAVVGAEVKHWDVRLGRARLEAATTPYKRAQAALWLAGALRRRWAAQEALEVLASGQAVLSGSSLQSEEEAALTARLLLETAISLYDEERYVEAWRHIQVGLSQLSRWDGSLARETRFELWASQRTPISYAHRGIDHALREASAGRVGHRTQGSLLLGAVRSHQERGDLRQAAALLDQSRMDDLAFNLVMEIEERAHLALRAGRIGEASARGREAGDIALSSAHGNEINTLLLAHCLTLRGEVPIAREMFVQIAGGAGAPGAAEAICWYARSQLGQLEVDCGAVAQGMSELRTILHEASTSGRDCRIYQAASTLTDCAIATHEGAQLAGHDILNTVAALRDAETIALSISGDAPPWYHALYPTLRGRLLALLSERRAEAIDMTQAALALCERSWSDAVPMIARTLATHLSTAGRFEECLSVIDRVTPQLVEERFLEENARIQAIRINGLVRIGSPQADIEQAMTALRNTLEETGAPRITADTLLELALLLPPESVHPDSLPLLEEAHELFAEMPIVAKEARCLEAIGDLLAARGNPDEARGYHRSAREILERHGLGLRVPLLDKKLEDRPTATTPAAS